LISLKREKKKKKGGPPFSKTTPLNKREKEKTRGSSST